MGIARQTKPEMSKIEKEDGGGSRRLRNEDGGGSRLRDEATLRGMVFDIQRMSINDGPGIRTTVFLKGCPLTCPWCHNPEGRGRAPQLAFTPALCIGCGYCFRHCPQAAHVMADGKHQIERERCRGCFLCVKECYSNALEVVGKEMAVAEVLDEVEKDRPFYDESGGGMTLSGGEPLAQFEFSRALLAGAKARDLHTCVETSGLGPAEEVTAWVPLVDLFLFDYKETGPERHRAYTGVSNEGILENLRLLDARGAKTILRCPIVPGANLREDHLRGIVSVAAALRHCQGIHILGYHQLGEAKRIRLGGGAETRFPDLSREEMNAVVTRLRDLGGRNVAAG